MFRRILATAFAWSKKWYLGSISASAGTFFLFENYFDFDRYRSIRYGGAAFFITFLFRVIVEYIREIDLLEAKVREKEEKIEVLDVKANKNALLTGYHFYGDAMVKLKDSFAIINKAKRLDNFSEKDLIYLLSTLSNRLKYILEKRNNYTYSVSIKAFVVDENIDNVNEKFEVKTIARDEDSFNERTNGKKIKHQIMNNTCFKRIFEEINYPSKSYYLNNELPIDRYYINSSFENYGQIPPSIKSDSDRREHWTLPYRSEVVVPISPYSSESLNRATITEFYGFLCVDCDHEKGFHDKYDPAMLQGVADGIFDLIKNAYKS